MARSPTNATSPHTVQTAEYAVRNGTIASPGRPSLMDALPKTRTAGRLAGSMIAAIITCQATRKSGRATHSGGPPWMSA